MKSLRIIVLSLALGGAACDLPTALPRWTTSWEVVAVEQTVTTADLLPSGVRIDPRGFAIDSFAVTSSIRLAQVCELCTCFDGPIPPLEFSNQDWPIYLPSGLTEAQLISGTARLVMTNQIGFDLLDDGEGGTGRLDVVLHDRYSGEVVDRVALTGSWPAGDSVALEFPLSQRRLHGGLVARVSGRTPGSGGCAVDLNEQSGFRARVELRDLIASSVSVLVSDAALALKPRSIRLPDAIAERLRPDEARVALEVRMTSRVGVAAEIDISVAPQAEALFTETAALHTPLALPTGATSTAVDARGLYLLDLERLSASTRIHFAARTRVTGSRVVRLTGAESLRYRLVVRAEVPAR